MGTGEEGKVYNVKDEQYSAMPGSWQAKNNIEMNKGMGYNNMADQANTPHPATKMEGAKMNKQMEPKAANDKYNYNANR